MIVRGVGVSLSSSSRGAIQSCWGSGMRGVEVAHAMHLIGQLPLLHFEMSLLYFPKESATSLKAVCDLSV